MKKKFFVSSVFMVGLLLPGRIECQEPGVKFGFVRARGDISRGIPGITWGPIGEFSASLYFSLDILGGQLGLQPEVNFVTKGFDALESDRGEEVSSKYKINYIEVPVLLYWKLPLKGRLRPGVFCGPYFGFATKVMEVQTALGETEERELGENLKGRDFGLVFGGNIRYGLGSMVLMIDIRYSLGSNNISKDITAVAYEFRESDRIRNRAFTVGLGVGFDLNEGPDD
jgi:hypothetical protein